MGVSEAKRLQQLVAMLRYGGPSKRSLLVYTHSLSLSDCFKNSFTFLPNHAASWFWNARCRFQLILYKRKLFETVLKIYQPLSYTYHRKSILRATFIFFNLRFEFQRKQNWKGHFVMQFYNNAVLCNHVTTHRHKIFGKENSKKKCILYSLAMIEFFQQGYSTSLPLNCMD